MENTAFALLGYIQTKNDFDVDLEKNESTKLFARVNTQITKASLDTLLDLCYSNGGETFSIRYMNRSNYKSIRKQAYKSKFTNNLHFNRDTYVIRLR